MCEDDGVACMGETRLAQISFIHSHLTLTETLTLDSLVTPVLSNVDRSFLVDLDAVDIVVVLVLVGDSRRDDEGVRVKDDQARAFEEVDVRWEEVVEGVAAEEVDHIGNTAETERNGRDMLCPELTAED